MISVTKLLFAREYFGDRLRYTKNAHTMRNGAAEGVGPVALHNKSCNGKAKNSCNMRETTINLCLIATPLMIQQLGVARTILCLRTQTSCRATSMTLT